MARRKTLSTAGRTGGRRTSTSTQFAQDVQTRLYGGNRRQSTLPRVAASRSSNTPEAVVRETNRLGGRNALRTGGTQSPHNARYREIRAALGMTTG